MPYCPRCGDVIRGACTKCGLAPVTAAGFGDPSADATIHDNWSKDVSTGDKLISSGFRRDEDVDATLSRLAGLDLGVCAGCGESIQAEKAVRALGKRYHPRCFNCSRCSRNMMERAQYGDDGGRPICSDCMGTQAVAAGAGAERCAECNQALSGAVVSARGSKYHEKCFKCFFCKAHLMQAGSTSFKIVNESPACDRCAAAHRREVTERARQTVPAEAKRTVTTVTHVSGVAPEEAAEIKATVDEGKIRCARCHQILTRHGFQAMGVWFHPECFLCAHCGSSISSDGYVNLNGSPYHEHCASHHRPAAAPTAAAAAADACTKCHRAVHGPRLTLAGKLYHPDCLKCERCARQLTASFSIVNGQYTCDDCARAASAAHRDFQAQNRSTIPGIRVDPRTGETIQVKPGETKTWTRPEPVVKGYK